MVIAKRIAKALIPLPVRRYLRAQQRALLFRRAMRVFSADPQSATGPGSRVLTDLVYGWGSDLSAREEYLEACIAEALTCNGPILECGSGLTTILIGLIAQRRGETMWTLEHHEVWGRKTRRYLERYKIKSVRVSVRPLKEYAGFSWYDPPLDVIPDEVAFVICDGPPRRNPGNRYGLLPVMGARLKPGCVILLDNGGREEEQAVARAWSSELGVTYKTVGTKKPFIRLVTGSGSN
jgi:hypothetical protein